MAEQWIGVDFDGTLSVYDAWRGAAHVGAPIKQMVDRVKGWLADGRKVRIFTARVYAAPDDVIQQHNAALSMIAIQKWCYEQFGCTLPVTCSKDFYLEEFWDDRAVQVFTNIGTRVDGGK